ncbi:16S rRNA (guanine(966)-N(2))-methyltransferase RsmD [Acidithiobacillus sp. M4-SHS-6]|uniref:16S rRNA (guanine(966)-N(2))-methyltransferase RsmD n=1 Tax=Acidithiobacillus sp. M4-SHS-6 TaxID=3383024 RepID=UPI0039BEB165
MTVRIIAGRCRGRSLLTPSGPGVRPTPGIVRERLFNWLGGAVAGARVLDLFAGSGALGLEAWSRNAKEVVFIEKNPQHRAILLRNLQRCDVGESQLAGKDALFYLQQGPRPFDIVFADPPFDQGWPRRLANALRSPATLRNPGWFYLESSAAEQWQEEDIPAGWRVHRHGHCGEAFYTLYSNQQEDLDKP